MPDRASVGRDPAARAEELMDLAAAASKRLIDGLLSSGMLAARDAEPARLQVREHARRLFLFVVLSVLLEKREGKDPSDRLVAERIKEDFSLELLNARKVLKSVSKEALPRARGQEDPFAPYYDSFEKMRANPDHGPFGILARRLADEHFEPSQRAAAYEEIFALAAALSDELIGHL